MGPTQDNKKVNLRIYYKNRKLKNLFISNNEFKPLDESSVVYKYTCDQETHLVEQRSYSRMHHGYYKEAVQTTWCHQETVYEGARTEYYRI